MAHEFELPDDDASDEEKQAALEAVNAVHITADQLKRAFATDPRCVYVPSKDMLLDFARAEGLQPWDVAACALAIRLEPIEESVREGEVDVMDDALDYFTPFASRPIDPANVNLFPDGETDDEIRARLLAKDGERLS